jgi:arginine deiminase
VSLSEVERVAEPRLGVGSDVERLRAVLVHRPGDELAAVPAAAPGRALFDEAPDMVGAGRDHDVLTRALQEHEVEVLRLDVLLGELVAAPAHRDEALALALPGTAPALRAWLAALPPDRIVRALLAGAPSPVDGIPPLPALPNLMYMRDSSLWVGAHALPATMREPSRRREGPLLDAIYRLHPRFAGASVRPRSRPPMEGGDILAAGDGRVIVGITERTGAGGARRLTSWLLGAAGVDEVVTIRLPRGAGFHLDLVLSMIDHDTFALWAPLRGRLRGHRWRRYVGGVRATALDDPLRHARVLAIPGTDAQVHGRDWDHGTNLLAVAPGVVVAYDDDADANERLRAQGIEVLEVPAAHLAAGRGGPRCLTCPVARAG